MLWLTLCLLAISIIIFRVVNSRNYWRKRNVVHTKSWPLLGDLKDTILRRRNVGDNIRELYTRFLGKRYFGTHMFTSPSLFITDVNLIKQITVRDFDYFVDHMEVVDGEVEPLFGKNLMALKGKKWRNMRNTLSPLFTGNKLRIMFRLIKDCAEQLNNHFLNKEEGVIEIEAKDVMSRVATDIIATVAFGVQCNSLKEDNEFYRTGTALFQNSLSGFLIIMIQMAFPKIAKKLGISRIPKRAVRFLEEVIGETLKQRQEKKIIRPDMIHIMMESRKAKQPPGETGHLDIEDTSTEATEIYMDIAKGQIPVEDVIAHGFLFFLAGFEIVSMLLAHTCHELAVNVDVQEKLQTEIDTAFEETKGDLDYETLIKMKYLDMVISGMQIIPIFKT